MYGGVLVCEGHKALFELSPRTNELEASLAYLKRWIRTAERCQDAEPLLERLGTIRDEFAAELAGLEAEAREIEERYSLPSGLEQLEAKEERGEEATQEPASEGERRWRELDARSRRLIAVADVLETELDGLHVRLEESVLTLLEREAWDADEEAARVREEFGL
jgi:hypothetical protein